mmetsp:Transcript_46872/g.124530  ORF Transcript_46872/g.124530 Transcript_46872/m.124530 type:complete len:309 (+) Transcript_46872:2262-3188(+)
MRLVPSDCFCAEKNWVNRRNSRHSECTLSARDRQSPSRSYSQCWSEGLAKSTTRFEIKWRKARMPCRSRHRHHVEHPLPGRDLGEEGGSEETMAIAGETEIDSGMLQARMPGGPRITTALECQVSRQVGHGTCRQSIGRMVRLVGCQGCLHRSFHQTRHGAFLDGCLACRLQACHPIGPCRHGCQELPVVPQALLGQRWSLDRQTSEQDLRHGSGPHPGSDPDLGRHEPSNKGQLHSPSCPKEVLQRISQTCRPNWASRNRLWRRPSSLSCGRGPRRTTRANFRTSCTLVLTRRSAGARQGRSRGRWP